MKNSKDSFNKSKNNSDDDDLAYRKFVESLQKDPRAIYSLSINWKGHHERKK